MKKDLYISKIVEKCECEIDEIMELLANKKVDVKEVDIHKVKMLSLSMIFNDLHYLIVEDPAVNGNYLYALESNAFQAVRTYRILNSINESLKKCDKDILDEIYNECMNSSDLNTKVSIAKEVKIGDRFIIDHGNDVKLQGPIEIGQNFHIMQDVKIINHSNDTLKIGNNVLIWGGSKIEADSQISIGNNVEIGAKCFINKSIQDNCMISLITPYIIHNYEKNTPIINGIYRDEDNNYIIDGKDLPYDANLKASIVKRNIVQDSVSFNDVRDGFEIDILEKNSSNIKLKIKIDKGFEIKKGEFRDKYAIKLFSEKNYIIFPECSIYEYIYQI